MRELVSEIIEAKPGVKRAVHVFTPALQHRMKTPGSELPVMALRSSLNGFEVMRLYHKIEMLGPSSMDEIFDNPLPGTGGRGVAICFTEFPLRVWSERGAPPANIKTPSNEKPEDILEAVLTAYDGNAEM